VLQLVFSDPIQCNSIAPDGSDFAISGTSAVSISKASGHCVGDDGLTSVINITLNSPIFTAGNYQITLKPGTDGNTIINQCGQETPDGSTISFSTKDTVTAYFDYNITYGCKLDTIGLSYQPANDVNQWQWIVDSVFAGSAQNPSIVESVFGPKQVQHIVSNGFCSDTVTRVVNLDNILQAAFQAPREVCPKDKVNFSNTSIGNILSWNWDFGDGVSSIDETPDAHLFPNTATGKTYQVTLVVKNNLGCMDTARTDIIKLQSCYITVPNAFTPNNDGRNDYLYPLNAFSVTDLEFKVYNRYGQLVFESRDWTRKWDGTISGKEQPTGTYVWMLSYTDASGKKFFLKGTSVLIR
jgi:gliding motility-associated-like protein